MTARDQTGPRRVHRNGMGASPRTGAALAAALTLGACGGFESPDLSEGTIEGRLLNARAGAYVYALGRPGTKAWPAADGRFELEGLPAGNVTLAVIDGPDLDGTRRAALVPATVEGADETEIPDVDAEGLPLAGRVWALARPEKGVVAWAPRVTAVGTDQIDVLPGPTGLALLDPLPEGSYEIAVVMGGFATASVAVAVAPASSMIEEIPLAIDPSSPAPGCASTGACVNGLVCDVSDGECEECVSDGECEARHGVGAVCSGGTCAAGSSTTSAAVCAACTSDGQCASGVCEGGICTRTCAGVLDCYAGFDCADAGARRVCSPRGGCEAYRERLGEECWDDARCLTDLARGRCRGADSAAIPPRPGYCTADCNQALPFACEAASGWVCARTGMAQYTCERG